MPRRELNVFNDLALALPRDCPDNVTAVELLSYENVTTMGVTMRRRELLKALPAIACVGSAFAAAAQPHVRVGLTAVILADQMAFLSRWGAYLSARVNAPVTFVARESYQDILDLLFSGQLEAAWVCGYPYVLHRPRLELLAVPVYQGEPLYRSYLIRPLGMEHGVSGWADLRDRVLAYSDPLSNSGWLVPQSQLRAAGIAPRDLRRGFFAHGHRNVAEAVAAKLAEAGCIDGYVWETMRRQNMAAARRTEVVWQSDRYGFPPLVVRAGMADDIAGPLQAALLNMATDTAGGVLLDSLNLDGFTRGSSDIFASIGRLAAEQQSAS